MSTALYRRYRPETFADVIGQEHVTEPLMQALRSGRVNHAYLFSGPRGCGKTTSARILARCLNCEQGPTPDPCGVCESCVALARGGPGSVDVIEIDAASHGGVDDARDLRERAAFGPAMARYKVYIIDEAHMVTSHGFNALLKVVEEPPEHVKFIFATTEPDKVLSTIRSRTHHYPFHLVPPQRLTAYLEQLSESEGVRLEPGVLSFVTRAGGGSVRDSLSVLDQLISGADERGLTYEGAAALLGFTDVELLDSVVDAVGAQDAAAVFRQVDKVMESGHDPRRFVEDLLERYRDLIVVAAVGERAGGLLRGMPEDQVERLRQQASVYGPSTLTRCADVVSRGLSEMTGAVSYRLHLELICARLLLPAAAGEEGYAARLDRIERRLAAGPGPATQAGAPAAAGPPAQAGPSAPARPPAQSRPPTSAPAAAPTAPVPTPSARTTPDEQLTHSEGSPAQPTQAAFAEQPDVAPAEHPDAAPAEPQVGSLQQGAPGSLDTDAVRRSWPEVLDAVKEIRRVTWTLVSVNSTVLDFDGRRVLLGLSSEGLATTFNQGVHAEVVRQALVEAIGLDARVEGTAAPGGASAPSARTRGGADGGPPQSPRPAAQQAGTSEGDLPTAAEQLGVTDNRAAGSQTGDNRSGDNRAGGQGDSRPDGRARRGATTSGAPPAQEWSESSREAPPPWAVEEPGETPDQRGSTSEQPRVSPADQLSADRPSTDQQSADQQSAGHQSADHQSANHQSAGEQGPPPPQSSPPPPSERAPRQEAAERAPVRPTPTQPEAAPTSAPEPPRRPGGDIPREDDEDLESSGAVGLPVIESVLGGTVIAVDDDPTH
ncbi:DNA polymerase III subunit gamma and tau [Ornithinimicrobium cryptoxanthini]|uniref:DNA-directed DNA polymerase n=1 Tax=Ornithinimicrobium cryptoxanthini TaxID=2934161 RepID=A0ABY4YJ33_9MICO|nr:DNA polymerase III subunit gamma and tau [Ornithinimicrobium cryptoxanthini]USQ76637.1 DNA polymerase III subunit gamma and tau [Ornithinimicrobium cryptoxanthini]